jgi:pyruvate/2-oxoglutarate dehydrogenase complex dihydrolipoamide acyltransferase (E2) component
MEIRVMSATGSLDHRFSYGADGARPMQAFGRMAGAPPGMVA